MATGHTNSLASRSQPAFPLDRNLDTTGREWTAADRARGDVGETGAQVERRPAGSAGVKDSRRRTPACIVRSPPWARRPHAFSGCHLNRVAAKRRLLGRRTQLRLASRCSQTDGQPRHGASSSTSRRPLTPKASWLPGYACSWGALPRQGFWSPAVGSSSGRGSASPVAKFFDQGGHAGRVPGHGMRRCRWIRWAGRYPRCTPPSRHGTVTVRACDHRRGIREQTLDPAGLGNLPWCGLLLEERPPSISSTVGKWASWRSRHEGPT